MTTEPDISMPVEPGLPAGWNDTSTDYERHGTIHGVVDDRAAERPDAVAVVDGERSLTYRELDERTGALARRLAGLLDGPDRTVGVLADRSVEAVVAFLGVLRAGAAFVPLDPGFPPDHLRYLAADTAVRAVLAPPAHLDLAAELTDAPVLALDDGVRDGDAPDGPPPDAAAPVTAGPRTLAYVMYTSGSSGRPKGVAVEHRSVLAYVRGAHDQVPGPDDVVLQAAQLGFDLSTYEIWGALCNGARLVVHPPGRLDPQAVARTVARHGVTVGIFATGALHEMIDAAPEALGAYRLVLAGGDVLSPGHARRLRAAHPGTRLVNAYGPTEATGTAMVFEVGDLPPGRSVPIGRPMANNTVHLLDGDLRPVAPGDVGEVCIGGDGVARGYLGLADLTAERFVPDPFGGDPDGRLYRSGDLARLLPDGELEYLGRLDDQVKIRGYRVEPAEVAAVLGGHPAVGAVEVVVREDLPGHKRLVAYVTAGWDVDPQRLRRYLRRRVPHYLVPSAFVVLDALPLTRNGKVDRSALPAPGRSGDGRPPSVGTEQDVARLWGRVLAVDDVLAGDDFLESGGDSLLALQLLAAVRDELGVELPLDAVFDHPTVADLARRIDGARRSPAVDGDRRLPPLVPVDHRPGMPASITQAQACFLGELADDALPYQSQAVVHLEGPLDPDVVRRALQRVVDRHDVLRTAFPVVDGVWTQQIHRQLTVALPVVDLRDDPDPRAALDRLVRERSAERIDPAGLPVFRATLARLADDYLALLYVEHHVIHDGFSFATVVRELTALVRAFAARGDDPLPPLRAQYADFAAWQHTFATTPAGRRQLAYWARELADLPPPPRLPTDRPTPVARSFRGVSLRRDLAPELVDALRRTAAGAGCTPFMVMVAAFDVLLARLSGENDVVIGSGLANRRLAGTEDLVGMFVNTVALRVDLGGDPTVATVLARVRAACLGAMEHQELPFEEVVRMLAPERRAGHNPLYEHLFSFHDAPFPETEHDGLRVRVRDALSNGSSKADLNVVVVNRRAQGAAEERPDGEELAVVWDAATDVLDPSTAARLLDAYLEVLAQVVARPDRPVSELELVPPDGRGALVAGAGTTTPYGRHDTVDGVFVARARETPDAVAVEAGPRRMTYAELDRASDRLAGRLAAAGVVPGHCVGVVDDRSPGAVVALLGILKAGAAYVGIDRHLPPARLGRLVGAAGVAVVCAGGAGAGLLGGTGVMVVDPEADDGDGGAPPPPSGGTHGAGDLAYVSFTSGSTGEPKGVEVLHRGVVRLVRGTDYVELGPDVVVLAAAPLAFDASTFELWAPLLNGGRVVLAPPGVLSTAELADVLTTHGVTTAWFTAAIFHRMVDHELGALAGLRQVVAGGDVLSPAHVDRLLGVLAPGAAVVNGYGPTEGTTFTCCHRMVAGTRVAGPVPIGRPVANTWVVVVDDCDRLVPAGLPGELWIGGDGVARGYAGRPDLTAAQFTVNPFPALPGERVYRSGDRVRRRDDGVVEFLGRVDRQVKVRGHRVEPAETEAALLTHPSVAAAHVAPVEFGRDDLRLVAYLVAAPGSVGPDGTPPVADAGLRDFLGASLPRYLVPSDVVWLDELPLLPNGKVDAGRLPTLPSTWFPDGPCAPPVTPASTLARPVPGAGRLEHTLVGIFQEVTGVRDVGLEDDFFDLGGHSLLAVELFAAIERSTGARLPLATIFEAPTVAALSAVLRSDGWDARTGSLVPLATSGSRPPFFAVTAGDGNVVGYGPLARRLGPDQPFYVLQPFGLDSAAPLHRTIGSMARHYVTQVRTVQDHGPYLIGGRCFGSLVAYEMATRLEAAGETVALLASIDSVGPLWRTRYLADGTVFDPFMNEIRLRAADGSPAAGDIFGDRVAAQRFTRWLRERVAGSGPGTVTRYMAAVGQVRPDVGRAFPLEGDDGRSAAGLLGWVRQRGRWELGMQPAFLPPPVPGEPGAPRRDPRLRTRRDAVRGRMVDLTNAVTRGRVPALAAGRREEILSIAHENLVRYRAGPLRARVVLIRPEEEADGHQQAQLARWYGLETGGVVERMVPGTHHGMLREPAVAALADCLGDCITEALEGARPGGRRLG